MARTLPVGVYESGKTHYQYRISFPKRPDGTKPRPEVRGAFLTPEDAQTAREQRRAELGLIPASQIGLDRQPLRQYADAYLISHSVNVDAGTIHDYRQRLTSYVYPTLGTVALRDITPSRVRDWQAALARDVSANTARQARAMLAQILRQAMADEILTRNAAALVRPVRYDRPAPVVLTPEQVVRLLDAAGDEPYAAMWQLGIRCQLRPGELAALRWADLDLDAGLLTVRASRTRNSQGRFVIGDGAKTVAGQRTIEMDGECVRHLRRHHREQLATRLALPPGIWQDHDLVFPNSTGRVLVPSTMGDWLTALCERAGVPRITPHGCRRAGATLARSIGIQDEVLQRRMGHTRVTQTLEYSYVVPGESRRASEALAAALEAIRRRAV